MKIGIWEMDCWESRRDCLQLKLILDVIFSQMYHYGIFILQLNLGSEMRTLVDQLEKVKRNLHSEPQVIWAS